MILSIRCHYFSLTWAFFFLPVVAETKSTQEHSHNFAQGDSVEVIEGELIHLQGKIITVSGNTIQVMPKHEDLKVRFVDNFIF